MRRIPILLFLITMSGLNAAPGIRLESYDYPFPTKVFAFESQQLPLEMVYMDVAPASNERGTVLLLHGKNFSGSYFGQTIAALHEAGYRVIVPDQIGFGKSSKPEHYQYSFQQLAENTRALLTAAAAGPVHVLGHSMGGMLATRFALLYPTVTKTLTLLNPIGLEDWAAKGVPYRPIDAWYQAELTKTPAKIRAYQLDSYYDGHWRDAYDPWVEQLASFNESANYPTVAWNQALTYDMIFTQPVVYDFPRLRCPTLLIIGQRDTTALGKDTVAPEVRARLGNYPSLGRTTRDAIPGAKLVELEGLGHMPHIEAFDRFFPPYRAFLDQQTSDRPSGSP